MNILYQIIIFPVEMIIESFYALLIVVFKQNHAVSILGISALVTLICLPLYAKAEFVQNEEGRIKKKMLKRTASIKKNFRGDEKHMVLAMYYRENHYHPLMALRSSLGLLVQAPFFIAAYHFLSRYGALRGESFLFIRDLGSPDGIIQTGTLRLNVLPFFMTAINLAAACVYSKNN
ncbi:MAG: YidC/Oxa1 family membrane protein insertase, partial [Treponema sp.]|nr:YidC/Oxa1 family membrane protein insertase [Treponema sp.]